MPLSRAIRAIFKSLSRLKGPKLLETLDTSRVLRWLLFPMLNNSMRSSGMCRRQNLAKKKNFHSPFKFYLSFSPLHPLPYFLRSSLTFLFYVCPYLGMIWKLSSPPTPRGVYFLMTPIRGCAAGQGVVFVLSVLNRVCNFAQDCPKQGNKIEGFVLNGECILGIFCPKQGQGLIPSAAHLYPNFGQESSSFCLVLVE